MALAQLCSCGAQFCAMMEIYFSTYFDKNIWNKSFKISLQYRENEPLSVLKLIVYRIPG